MIVRSRGSGSLYQRYRPRTWEELLPTFDKEAFIEMISSRDHPRVFLFAGPHGTGKTTVARVMARAINYTPFDPSNMRNYDQEVDPESDDLPNFCHEENIGDARGIDDVRQLSELIRSGQMTLTSGVRNVFILDECQMLTGPAQNALLKVLEDTPEDTYIVLCTTHPKALIDTLRDRPHLVTFTYPGDLEVKEWVDNILKAEEKHIPADQIEAIASASNSLRECLNKVERVLHGGTPEGLPQEGSTSTEVQIITRSLLATEKRWTHIAKILKAHKGNCESLRVQITWYLRGMLLNSRSLEEADKIATLMEELTNPITGPDEGPRLASLLFKAWRKTHGEEKKESNN